MQNDTSSKFSIHVVVAKIEIPVSEVQGMFEIIQGLMALACRDSKAGSVFSVDFSGDWACVECKPHSDMLIDGFQCAYHKGKEFLGRYGIG